MGRRKTPQEKKQLSYDRDRRSIYGENDKSSRKNIPLSKQRAAGVPNEDERASRLGSQRC